MAHNNPPGGGLIAGGTDPIPLMAPGYRVFLSDGERAIRADGRIFVWHVETGWMDTLETVDFGPILSALADVK